MINPNDQAGSENSSRPINSQNDYGLNPANQSAPKDSESPRPGEYMNTTSLNDPIKQISEVMILMGGAAGHVDDDPREDLA